MFFVLAVTAFPASWVAAADGAALYQKNCATCHGEQGRGDGRGAGALNPRPRDFTTAPHEELTRERMVTSVTYGRPGTAMVGWEKKFSPEEISRVVDYIRERFMPSQRAANAPASHGPGGNSRRHVPVDAPLGQRVYALNCAVCHGEKGSGAMWTRSALNPPPRDFSKSDPQELTRERMLNSVSHGRPDTAMMPFSSRLAPHEIAAAVDYIRATFLGKAAAPPANPPHGGAGTLPPGHSIPPGSAAPGPSRAAVSNTPPVNMEADFPNGLRGDYAAGKRFFLANCYTCHGVQGDGNGPRAAFNTPRPRNFLSAESRARFNRPALLQAVTEGKVGTVMPAWGKVLTPQEIADVAEFVFQAYIRPTAARSPVAEVSEKKKVDDF